MFSLFRPMKEFTIYFNVKSVIAWSSIIEPHSPHYFAVEHSSGWINQFSRPRDPSGVDFIKVCIVPPRASLAARARVWEHSPRLLHLFFRQSTSPLTRVLVNYYYLRTPNDVRGPLRSQLSAECPLAECPSFDRWSNRLTTDKIVDLVTHWSDCWPPVRLLTTGQIVRSLQADREWSPP